MEIRLPGYDREDHLPIFIFPEVKSSSARRLAPRSFPMPSNREVIAPVNHDYDMFKADT